MGTEAILGSAASLRPGRQSETPLPMKGCGADPDPSVPEYQVSASYQQGPRLCPTVWEGTLPAQPRTPHPPPPPLSSH